MTNKLFNELMQKNAEGIYNTPITESLPFMESKMEKAARVANEKAAAEKKKAKTAGAKAAKTKRKTKTTKAAKKVKKDDADFRAFVYEKLGIDRGGIEYGVNPKTKISK